MTEAIAASASVRHDARVLGLVGTGHFVSHFFHLSLAPLFPLLVIDFGVSYMALGLAVALYNGASGAVQVPIGFLVDRIGARIVLIVGLLVQALAFVAMSAVPTFEWLLVLAVIAGAANSVFHPANYSILSHSVDQRRMGRAFSIHTFTGHLGNSVAPATIIFIAALWGWRMALAAAGAAGLVMVIAMIMQSSVLIGDSADAKPDQGSEDIAPAVDGFKLLFSAPMLMFFLFFSMTSMTTSGITSFSIVALGSLHGMSLESAGVALTGYLFASALGILLGGIIADMTSRHNFVAALAFIATAGMIGVIGVSVLPAAFIIGLYIMAGLCQGIIRPARDMMVRAVAPKGTSGKVFGFVSTGIAVGGTLVPIFLGWVIDQGQPQWIFYLIALFNLLALATIITPKRKLA
ncbi:MAG: MFS transporter [Rhodospirillales bacterium]|nr:MFS transporter [Rhodospirillales bacterium]